MDFKTLFTFTRGLVGEVQVPARFLERALTHVADVERRLGLEVTQYRDNPPHWRSTTPTKNVSDEEYCTLAERHNAWVRDFYSDLARWQKTPPKDAEPLTPADAARFWYGLREIQVPVQRWTDSYYCRRMEYVYEVLRGRDCEATTGFDEPLSPQQAADVVRLLDQWLDRWDLRLAVVRGGDRRQDGDQYSWCCICGAVDEDELCEHLWWCDADSLYRGEGAAATDDSPERCEDATCWGCGNRPAHPEEG